MRISSLMFSLLTFSTSLYILLISFSYWINILSKHLNKNIKQRKFFYGRFFSNLVHYFPFVFFRPCCQILFVPLFCSEDVMQLINIDCNFQDSLYFIIYFVSCLCIFLALLTQWWLIVYFNNIKQFKKDYLSIDKDPYYLF